MTGGAAVQVHLARYFIFCVFVSDILPLKFSASKNFLHGNSVAKSMNFSIAKV